MAGGERALAGGEELGRDAAAAGSEVATHH